VSDVILLDGDAVVFTSVFGPATVVVRSGTLSGSGPAKIGGKRVCVDGDERRVMVAGCIYTTPQYSTPGTGLLKIAALAPDGRAKTERTGGKALLLKGGNFTASFEVQTPAQQPPPGPGSPIPDATPQYSGTGTFRTVNTSVKAS
jgi:hypothetical protein